MKIVLVILLMTVNGPSVIELAEFQPKNAGYCDAVGQLVVANVKQQENVSSAMYRCVDRTDV